MADLVPTEVVPVALRPLNDPTVHVQSVPPTALDIRGLAALAGHSIAVFYDAGRGRLDTTKNTIISHLHPRPPLGPWRCLRPPTAGMETVWRLHRGMRVLEKGWHTIYATRAPPPPR
jgi:hypothetical protein